MATDKQESIIELNRYRNVNRKDISDVINFLKTNSKDKSAPNSWSKRFKTKLTVKDGKLYLDERLVVANEDRDDLMRKITYDTKSDVAPSRDAGYHLIKKRYANISRRQWVTFLKKQRVIRMTDNAPAKKKAGGKKLNKKGELEMDLFFISRDDVPKHMQIGLKELYPVLVVADRLTSLCYVAYTGLKTQAKVNPKVRLALEFFSQKMLNSLSFRLKLSN